LLNISWITKLIKGTCNKSDWDAGYLSEVVKWRGLLAVTLKIISFAMVITLEPVCIYNLGVVDQIFVTSACGGMPKVR
jgi:hypothetical protein